MNRVRVAPVTIAFASAALLAGCGSSGTQLASGGQPVASGGGSVATTPPPTGNLTPKYNPAIDPAKFSPHITNQYLPLVPGTTRYYVGSRDGVPTKHVVSVTRQTRTIIGVTCVVVKDVVTQNGSLVEKTTDWYSQDSSGNVWYFGENTAEYSNGVVTTTAGTWEAGVDHAKPGIVMEAVPKLGDAFRQEYLPGVALDIAKIVGMNGTARVPAGTFHHLVITFDKNPLDPTKLEHKWYAKGIGFVHAVLHQGNHTEITSLVK